MRALSFIETTDAEQMEILDYLYYQDQDSWKISELSAALKMENRKVKNRLEQLAEETSENSWGFFIKVENGWMSVEFSAKYFRQEVYAFFLRRSPSFLLLDTLFQRKFVSVQQLSTTLHISPSSLYRRTAELNQQLKKFHLQIDYSLGEPIEGDELKIRYFFQRLYIHAGLCSPEDWPFNGVSYLTVRTVANRLQSYFGRSIEKIELLSYLAVARTRRSMGAYLVDIPFLDADAETKEQELQQILQSLFSGGLVEGENERSFIAFFFLKLENWQDIEFEVFYSQLGVESSMFLKRWRQEMTKCELVPFSGISNLNQRICYLSFLEEYLFISPLSISLDMEIFRLKKAEPLLWEWHYRILRKLQQKKLLTLFSSMSLEELTCYFCIMTIDLFERYRQPIKVLIDIRNYSPQWVAGQLRKNITVSYELINLPSDGPDILITDRQLDYGIPGCEMLYLNSCLASSFWNSANNLFLAVEKSKMSTLL